MSFDYQTLNLRALMVAAIKPEDNIKLDALKEVAINKLKSGEIRSIEIDGQRWSIKPLLKLTTQDFATDTSAGSVKDE